MGTKNLYENGPNPFFFMRDKKIGQSQTYGNGFVSAWFRQVWVRSDFSSLSLSMRGRYDNEIAK